MSLVSAQLVARAAVRFMHIAIDGPDGDAVYWIERRPEESGRCVIVRYDRDGRIGDVSPSGTNVRSRVQETESAPYAVAGGILYYSDAVDNRLYRLAPGGSPEALTPDGSWLYADLAIDVRRRRLVCVREDHTPRAGA